jgi:hypothetical protein
MLISGIILFSAPPGRIANWSYWAILGLTKKQWQSIHIIFTFLFVIAGSFHIYFNWKPLMHYLKAKKQSAKNIKVELLLAIFVGILIFNLTLFGIPPFSSITDFGDYLTESWENETNTPPISHAERLTLYEISNSVNIPINKIIQKLKESNIEFSNELTLAQIADKNNYTPNELFLIINKSSQNIHSSNPEGKGYGRKTIEDVCNELNIDIEEGLLRLSNKSIKAISSSKIKDIANNNDLLPIDIYNIIANIKN